MFYFKKNIYLFIKENVAMNTITQIKLGLFSLKKKL